MASQSLMFWWDWTGRRKRGVLAIILVLSAIPWLRLGWLPDEPGAFFGATAFLAIPQMMALALAIGARTGRITMFFGAKASRADGPIEFWCVATPYAGVLLLALTFIVFVFLDAR